jgi:UDP-glucose 4-epimerase
MSAFSGKNVLITGGLGFIGSNLAIRLAELGAQVLLVDAMLPLYGGNLFNIGSIRDKVCVNFSDIRDRNSMNYLVQDQDYVFHLAGQVSHVDSILDPFMDVDINVNGTLSVLEACRSFNAQTKIIFTGTRGQYGAAVSLPVDENAPTNPKGMYAITNLTAEKIVLMYHEVHGIRGTCLRITNTYGPRHQMKHNRYGVANWFMRLAMDDQTIPLMGDGSILRDFVYVDDLVEALLQCAQRAEADGEIFNVGSGHPVNFRDLAGAVIRIAGMGRIEYVQFTEERKALEPGDYYSAIDKISATLGWAPRIPLEEGLRRTIDYYRMHRGHYWGPSPT